jgi:hypothetical protein
MGFRSFWPAAGPEVCWRQAGSMICKEWPGEVPVDDAGPAESLPLDPEIGFEVQKFIAFYALLNLPESYKQDWINMMRIYRLGDSTDPFETDDGAPVAGWVDPVSGASYVARRYGTETIDGQTVDRGIAARMLDWMGLLTSKAYETTTEVGMDGQEKLVYVKGPDGQPKVISQRFVNRVKAYQGLIDYVQQVTSQFGFYDPYKRGVLE